MWTIFHAGLVLCPIFPWEHGDADGSLLHCPTEADSWGWNSRRAKSGKGGTNWNWRRLHLRLCIILPGLDLQLRLLLRLRTPMGGISKFKAVAAFWWQKVPIPPKQALSVPCIGITFRPSKKKRRLGCVITRPVWGWVHATKHLPYSNLTCLKFGQKVSWFSQETLLWIDCPIPGRRLTDQSSIEIQDTWHGSTGCSGSREK